MHAYDASAVGRWPYFVSGFSKIVFQLMDEENIHHSARPTRQNGNRWIWWFSKLCSI